jgi:hypothetical protein
MFLQQAEPKQLFEPTHVTAAGSSGSWIDLQGFIGPGVQEIKFVLAAGPSSTKGTCGGTIEAAQKSDGTGSATLLTFDTFTSAGGLQAKHAVVDAEDRWVRFNGTVQSGKNMILSANLIAQALVRP